jgi:hypothetical protein
MVSSLVLGASPSWQWREPYRRACRSQRLQSQASWEPSRNGAKYTHVKGYWAWASKRRLRHPCRDGLHLLPNTLQSIQDSAYCSNLDSGIIYTDDQDCFMQVLVLYICESISTGDVERLHARSSCWCKTIHESVGDWDFTRTTQQEIIQGSNRNAGNYRRSEGREEMQRLKAGWSGGAEAGDWGAWWCPARGGKHREEKRELG